MREKWEKSLDLDELPDLEKFFTFINETTFRFFTLEADSVRDKKLSNDKRALENSRAFKFRKGNDGACARFCH